MTGYELKWFLENLTHEQLECPVYFDTEARTFDYHMAEIGTAYYEESVNMITLHEKNHENK